MGFIFGIFGFTFGLLGFVLGTNALTNSKELTDKIDRLEQRLDDARILNREAAND